MLKFGRRRPRDAGLAAGAAPFVRRRHSPAAGRALEALGHAIEYLADEFAADEGNKGALGSADPRVEAIQVLKGLNRAVYFSGTPAESGWRWMRRWLSSGWAVGKSHGR